MLRNTLLALVILAGVGCGSDDVNKPAAAALTIDTAKELAGEWADEAISDETFLRDIAAHIEQGVFEIPPTPQGPPTTDPIPGWVKNNAGWWAAGHISCA